MKPAIVIICNLLALFYACKDDEEPVTYSGECRSYAHLYYSNYDSLASDPISVSKIEMDGDYLKLTVNYSGCTTDHPIDLALVYPLCPTPPPTFQSFEIRHNSRGETCEMWVTNERCFDLKPLREEGKNEIALNISWEEGNNKIGYENIIYSY